VGIVNRPDERFRAEIASLRSEGLYKQERIIASPQDVVINTREAGRVLNFCANNYLGLADHPEVLDAAARALKQYGFGMASVRFICGTSELHKALEARLADFMGTEDAILYSSCFDANTGLFETLLGNEDAVISDALNHASIIDGIRLCKAQRLVYGHDDMGDLERCLKEAEGARTRLVVTDGVFSMNGDIARLPDIVRLARRHDALVMVDDSHGTGVLGAKGRGAAEHHGVLGGIDIYTSTLGKALGGGAGGFTAARQPIVELLRQRSRPYLFSNSLPPPIVAGALEALDIVQREPHLRERLWENTAWFRQRMNQAGFELRGGAHPIVPVMLYEAELAQKMAAELLREGIYVIGFSYPVVPKGEARIRVQLTAAHSREQLEHAVTAFHRVGRELGLLRG
jgi:glycine C-acetyltransferase